MNQSHVDTSTNKSCTTLSSKTFYLNINLLLSPLATDITVFSINYIIITIVIRRIEMCGGCDWFKSRHVV